MAPAAPEVPAATLALIGGSGSLAADLAAASPALSLRRAGMVFATPWGDSPPFSLFDLGGRALLHVAMHGWRDGFRRGLAARQVFSVLQRAGVRRILSDAGVGSLNHLLDPGDLLIADDFVDHTRDRDGDGLIVGGRLLIMREPLCAACRAGLAAAARELAPDRRLFTRGTYVVTEGPRFETPAEVRALQRDGDVVGQSLAPEAWLARDIGACYANLAVIVNYGEGVVRDWEHDVLARIFREDAGLIAAIMLTALAGLADEGGCRCADFRPPTLLR